MSKIVCFCNFIKEDEIIDAIKNGATTLSMVQNETLAATGCGRCIPTIDTLIDAFATREKE